jgi:hypothetical protein
MKEHRIERETLYDQVWSEPITKLAKKYQISDVGLLKICKKLHIPVPGRGHWAKKRRPKRPPLPVMHGGPSSVIHRVTERIETEIPTQKEDPEEIRALIDYEKDPAHKITVSERLVNPHPLVQATKIALEGQVGDKYGRLFHYRMKYLNVGVTKASLPRTLRIMDALIKALEKRQIKVSSAEDRTKVTLLGQTIAIKVEEPVRQRQRELTLKEQQELRERGYVYDRYVFDPSGQLVLKIDEWGESIRKEWKDGKTSRIEDCLNDFIISLIRMSYSKKMHQIAQEEARIERQRVEAERYEKLRIIEEEKKKLTRLEEEVELWQKSQLIRAYVEAMRLRAGAIDPESKLAHWIEWAMKHADRMDPLTDSPPHIMDEEAKLRGY